MCIGGWLGTIDTWTRIEDQWAKRIAYENRISASDGLRSVRRYHAADLEYREQDFKGWSKQRQVQFTKNLIDIIGCGRLRPIGIACSVNFDDLHSAFPEDELDRNRWEKEAYRLCMMSCLKVIADTMYRAFPGEQVAVVHDRGKFNHAALNAFEITLRNPKIVNRESIVSIAPLPWEKCVSLQPADLFAYEGRKLLERGHTSVEQFRKSLRRLIGNRVQIRAHFLPREGLQVIGDRLRKARHEREQSRI